MNVNNDLSVMGTTKIPCARSVKYILKLASIVVFIPLLVITLSTLTQSDDLIALGASSRNARLSGMTPNDESDSKIVRPCSQPERLLSIQNYCAAHPELKENFTRHPMSKLDKFHVFLVDERHKLLFCAVPKAAVTLWRTMFLRGTGKIDKTKEKIKPYHAPYLNRMGLKFLYNYTEAKQQEIIRNYFKIMNTRHPVERALSSYMDKFVYSELEFPILESIEYLNKNYRSPADQIRLTHGRNTIPSGVRFDEFVSMVLDEKAPYNIHWDSMINICHPCIIHYDYVMKTETMQEDAPYILSLLSSKLKEPLELSKIHSHRDAVFEDPEKPHEYTKPLPELLNITDQRRHLFVKNFQRDMDMFGYKFQERDCEISCTFETNGRGRCC
ncbi:hypothetical protein CAPTEDRAFT_221303 [Capitella teleta]|nr:hypothetical protein CAPTEDRAFT_221303 [Capitella teleta]|eukprot:ELU05332.1 hypothetical protein CAPTEDRAFT_221303 [Capitella teleta]